MEKKQTEQAVETQPIEIELSRRFVKLVQGIDNFPEAIRKKPGELSFVYIGKTLSGKRDFYHEDGVFEPAYLNPCDNSDCIAKVLHSNGTTEDVMFSYNESGILVPADSLTRRILHPGTLRKPHPSKTFIGILERRAGEPVLINDNMPPRNNIYSLRILGNANGVGYNAHIRDDDGIERDVKFGYETLAGVLVSSKEKFSGELTVRAY
jgi:hypothetical protein